MTEIAIRYEGDLRTCCVHAGNKKEIWTDAPKDNQGLGRDFSPTDLLAASLGSCALTLMGLAARKLQVDITGTETKVTKEMHDGTQRRVGKIKMLIHCPHHFPKEISEKLIEAAENCPVRRSIHPDTEIEITYSWAR